MLKSRLNSFKYAFAGLKTAAQDQPNFLIHCLVGSVVIFAGSYFNISQLDWLILALTIGLVITVELTNTAIEEIVNSFTDQVHPAAKKAKDVAAAAVLVSSITAVIIGLVIFLPYLY
jgi:diacylglycerol kinase